MVDDTQARFDALLRAMARTLHVVGVCLNRIGTAHTSQLHRIEASYESCTCGRSTIHLHSHIQRFSDLNGGDDKITCAATPGAQADALGYLNSL